MHLPVLTLTTVVMTLITLSTGTAQAAQTADTDLLHTVRLSHLNDTPHLDVTAKKNLCIVAQSIPQTMEDTRLITALKTAFTQNGWGITDTCPTSDWVASFTVKHKSKAPRTAFDLSVVQMDKLHRTPLKEVYHATIDSKKTISDLIFYRFVEHIIQTSLPQPDGQQLFDCFETTEQIPAPICTLK